MIYDELVFNEALKHWDISNLRVGASSEGYQIALIWPAHSDPHSLK